MQRSNRIITINPTRMNVNDSYFLFHALHQLASNQLSYFPKDTTIELATPINITLTNASNEVSLVGLKSLREISQKITEIVFEFAEILK